VELQDFITETLVEVANGIGGANNKLNGAKGHTPNASPTFMLRPGTKSELGSGIEFDVAVTTKKSGNGKAGAKFRLAVVEAELGGGGGISKETVSRIKFSSKR